MKTRLFRQGNRLRQILWGGVAVCCLTASLVLPVGADDALVSGWEDPPLQARLRAYWWWLNGNVTKEAITKDLEWMKSIGMGGGLVFDAGGATQGGHAAVPAGPMFASPEWRALFKHTLREADRLGLEIALNLQSGWNLGGPLVTPDKSAKVIAWSQTQVKGPTNFADVLPKPAQRDFCPDTFTLAYRLKDGMPPRKPIRKLAEKSAYHELGMSAADCSPLLEDEPPTPGEEDVLAKDVLDLTDKREKDGTLRWDVPEGTWVIMRFGYVNNGAHVSTSSGKWNGLVLDYLDADALRWYWREVIDPIIADVGPLCGTTWKMVQTDSWELGGVNWTEKFADEFRNRRGYDIRPWLPVIAGKLVESRSASNRFLTDFRRTIADCVADNHYGTMAKLAHEHGMGIQPESAGPHTAPLDGLMCYGRSDWPMSEFWVPSPHRPTDERRFFVKQAASAAHIYGKPVVCAEGFTSIGPQWNDVLWSSQKPSFDHEACAGLNLVFWHAFTCSPKEMGLPGQEYFAGTHFNPQVTWSSQAKAFVSYLNRCQFMLQQGRFVADALYYYGDHVPNIARLKQDDPAKVLPEHDYDVVNEEVLLQASARDGRIVLPSGMSYRVLVLPRPALSTAAAKKVEDLRQAGIAICRPEETKEVLRQRGVQPDVTGSAHWIHRSAGDTDIYFVANQEAKPVAKEIGFRVTGKRPELWDAVSGKRHRPSGFVEKDGRTVIPLEFAPYGSWFIVFRGNTSGSAEDLLDFQQVAEISGPWEVTFGSRKMTFEKLVSWTTLPETRHFSGTATYHRTFDAPHRTGRLFLDLGNLSMLAEIRLNGKDLGVVWCPPWRTEITGILKPAGNTLEVKVVNGWWNQLVGDPKHEHTQTNIRLKPGDQPQESGLFGPVTIVAAQSREER